MTKRSSTRVGTATIAALAITGLVGAGVANAENGRGMTLTGVDNGDCTATFTLTNYTNQNIATPDWWFESEWDGPPPPHAAAGNSGNPPYELPWRQWPSTDTNWAFARYIGMPPTTGNVLAAGLGSGVKPWYQAGSGGYKSDAQQPGFVTTKTIDLTEATNPLPPPEPAADGSHTIKFRIDNGPVAADRIPEPQTLVVTGCDFTAPAAPDLTLTPSEPTVADSVIASGNAEPGSTVTVTADTGETCTATADPVSGDFSCSLGTLPEGDRTVTATATDTFGNESDGTEVLVTVAPADVDCEMGSLGSLGSIGSTGSSCGTGSSADLGLASSFGFGSLIGWGT